MMTTCLVVRLLEGAADIYNLTVVRDVPRARYKVVGYTTAGEEKSFLLSDKFIEVACRSHGKPAILHYIVQFMSAFVERVLKVSVVRVIPAQQELHRLVDDLLSTGAVETTNI